MSNNRRVPVRSRSTGTAFRPQIEALERRELLTAGLLDTSFGGDGKVDLPINPDGTNFARIFAVAVQPGDGKIVAGGVVRTSLGADFAVARFNADGTLDEGFGVHGEMLVSFE